MSESSFDPFGCELDGMRLIEASAGTGKTWNLCAIYLRLLLERGLTVQQILVVTFTNAATAELRARIRSRIVEALDCLHGAEPPSADRLVPALLAAARERGAGDEALRTRLELGLQTFDEAAILTIHGFCQRARADAPFGAQLPLASEPLADDAEIVAEAACDFWRRHVAAPGALPPALAAHLAERADDPERWARLLRRHLAKPLATLRWPQALAAAADFDAASLQAAHDAARALWQGQRDAIVETLRQGCSQLHAGTFKPEAVAEAAQGWDRLLASGDALAPAGKSRLDLFARDLQVHRTNKGRSTPQHAFFDLAQQLLDLRAGAMQQLALQRLALLRRLLAEGSAAVREAKRRRRVLAFDDMLFNLHERLAAPDGGALAAALRARFPAALIDEFQDTDPLQFAIFDALYGATALPLLLVGDPKQAIYSFRNADLPTYLHARARARATYTLAANQRSVAALIDGLNALFGTHGRAFMQPRLAYHPVFAGDKPRSALHDAAGPGAPLQVWLLPEAPGLMLKQPAVAAAAAATASEIARLITAGGCGALRLGDRPLVAGDIAVLVRSHAQAATMRRALAAAGVGAVELSRASVFHGDDAAELACLLAAVQAPQREPLVRAALATSLLGLDARAIAALAGDEAGWIAYLERFAHYRDLWRTRGIAVMLRELMFAQGLPARLLARADGERRLTNWLHLAECLHQAAQLHAAPDALLRWFERQRQDGQAADEAAQLRLESDSNLVQIVTVHKAKGLEYGIVCCPLLWDGSTSKAPRAGGDGIEYHDADGRGVLDFRAGLDESFDAGEVKARRHLDSAAEELRLIYVALTRAVHRCVVVAGSYERRSGKGLSSKESATSLLNWLVAGSGIAPEDWLAGAGGVERVADAWRALAARAGQGCIDVAPLPQGERCVLSAARLAPEQIGAREAPARIAPAWRIGSYSALVQGAAHEAAAADHDARAAVAGPPPAEGADSAPPARDDILRFPRGPAAGTCLHALFERADFVDPARWPEAIEAALELLPGDAQAAPRTEHAAMLERLLRDVLAAPLPVGTDSPLVLSGVPRARRLVELEFHLPVQRLDAPALNALLAELAPGGLGLDFKPLRGYLKGYIDLVVEHEGRYFIVDWKSNHLGDRAADYGGARLAEAMAGQGYHLQALCYALALDRLLRRRLRDFDAQRHFGGVLYLFVRGLRPGWTDADGRPAGMHFQRPSPETLARFEALIDRPQGAER